MKMKVVEQKQEAVLARMTSRLVFDVDYYVLQCDRNDKFTLKLMNLYHLLPEIPSRAKIPHN